MKLASQGNPSGRQDDEGHASSVKAKDGDGLPLGFNAVDTVEALSEFLDAGQVTSSDLTQRAIARAEALRAKGSVAFTRLWPDEALVFARREDTFAASGSLRPSPLAGLPIAVKDNCDVRGDVTQAGARVLAEFAPAQQDAICVSRLRSAGAVIIGKTNMSEFAYANTGDNITFGMPRNPCDPERLVGGSSSGSAAAVADGSVVAALGTDTGGSIRGPAALCGLTAFKPSEKRIPSEGVVPISATFDTIGPIARSIESCAIIDAVLSNSHYRKLPEYPLRGLSFGIPTTMVLDDLDNEVAAVFQGTVKALSESGASVSEFSWPETEPGKWRQAYHMICRNEAYEVHGDLVRNHQDAIHRDVVRPILSGASVTSRVRWEALNLRKAAVEASHDLIGRFHAVIMPTVPIVAPLIKELNEEHTAGRIEYLIGRNNEIANFFDCCAATVPCQELEQLPVGLLIMAKSGEDRRVLSIAKAVETCIGARHHR